MHVCLQINALASKWKNEWKTGDSSINGVRFNIGINQVSGVILPPAPINSVSVKCPDWDDDPFLIPLCSINPQNLWIHYYNWPVNNHNLSFTLPVLSSSSSSSYLLCCVGFPLENTTLWLAHTNECQAGRCVLLDIKEGAIITWTGPVYARQQFQSFSWDPCICGPQNSPPPPAHLCCDFTTTRSSISIGSDINVRQEHQLSTAN